MLACSVAGEGACVKSLRSQERVWFIFLQRQFPDQLWEQEAVAETAGATNSQRPDEQHVAFARLKPQAREVPGPPSGPAAVPAPNRRASSMHEPHAADCVGAEACRPGRVAALV